MERELAVVIMGAGKGTRMKDPGKAKVMYTINGRPMIDYVVNVALALAPSRTVVVVGWQKESVIDYLSGIFPSVVCVEQIPQLGTGHAVMQADEKLRGFSGDVLVLSGDVPLLSKETIRKLVESHRSARTAATVLTANLNDATGYGRIVRNGHGDVVGIVEDKDATDEQKGLREINSGIYVFDKERLFEGLQHITPSNSQKEYYLTDVFQYFWRNHLPVQAVMGKNAREILGINTLQQLEEARAAIALGDTTFPDRRT